jgi:hypothetical protein
LLVAQTVDILPNRTRHKSDEAVIWFEFSPSEIAAKYFQKNKRPRRGQTETLIALNLLE